MIQHLIDFLSEGTSAFHVTAHSIKVLEENARISEACHQ